MLLSSIPKLAFYTGLEINPDNITGGLPKNKALDNKRALIQWRSSISHSFRHYLGRELLAQSRTEYFDTSYRQVTYFPDAVPILSVTSLFADGLGQYDNSEYEITTSDYIIGKDRFSIVLNYPVLQHEKGLRLIYTGGLAYHAVNSTFIVSDMEGSPNTNHYAFGESTESVGKVVSWNAVTGALVVENLYGIFDAGESLAFQTIPGDDDSNVDGISGSIDSIYQQSLAEAYPDLERAVEIETRFMVAHQKDFENTGSDPQGNTMRRSSTIYQTVAPFQPETIAILDRYRRVHL